MSEAPTRTDRFFQLSLIIGFLVFLVIPVVGQMTGFSGTDRIYLIENRGPAPVPVWPHSLEGLKNLTGSVDAFVNDYFGFRSQLVWLNSRTQYLLGASGSDRVLIGSEGWLFLHKTRHRVVDEYRGLVKIPESEVEAWVQSMVDRRDWLEERDIPFVLAIPPVKHTIYHEFLPHWVKRVAPTRLDKTIERIQSSTDLVFADVRRAVSTVKADTVEQLYWSRDTHWNYRGSFAGYSEIMEKVNTIFPGLPVVQRGDIEFFRNGNGVGDLARMLYLGTTLAEPRLGVRFRGGSNLVKVDVVDGDGLVKGTIQQTEKHRMTSITHSKLSDRPRALIIRDSFTNAMAPYLRETFGTTIFAYHHLNWFDQSLVDRFQPDIVIFIIVEKALYHRPKDYRYEEAAP